MLADCFVELCAEHRGVENIFPVGAEDLIVVDIDTCKASAREKGGRGDDRAIDSRFAVSASHASAIVLL